MKYLFFLVVMTLCSLSLNGQRQELINELSAATCECLQGKDLTTDFEMTMGLCAIQSTSGRREEIKEVLDIDLTDLNQYEALGELIGMTMVTDCPVFMEKMMEEIGEMDSDELNELISDDDEEEENWSDMEAASEMSAPEYGGPENKSFVTTDMEDTNGSGLKKPELTGVIKSINPGLFNAIAVKGADGKTHTLYLASDLTNRGLLKKGSTVTLGYRNKSMFNAEKGATETVKLITKIEK